MKERRTAHGSGRMVLKKRLSKCLEPYALRLFELCRDGWKMKKK